MDQQKRTVPSIVNRNKNINFEKEEILNSENLNCKTGTSIYEVPKHEITTHENIVENSTEKFKRKNNKRKRRKRVKTNRTKEIVGNFNQSKSQCATTSLIGVNGEITESLIDTGAHTSFISETYCKRRNFNRYKVSNPKRWVTANGQPLEIGGQVTLNLEIGKQQIIANFIVAKQLAHHMILGRDIMEKHDFKIDFSTKTLSCGTECVTINSITTNPVQLLHSNENLKINPNSSETIWLKYNSGYQNLYLEGVGRNKSVKMLTTSQEQEIPVLIRNTTETTMNIRKGDLIAKVSPIEVVCQINDAYALEEFLKTETGNIETINSIATSTNVDYSKPWRPSEQIKIQNKSLTPEQKQKLKDLIDKYWCIFSRDDEDIGQIPEKYGTHDIIVTSEVPIKQRAYQTPQAKEEVVKNSINKMLKMSVIEESNSCWSSPIVLVKKADGSERFCVDYRKLNERTIKDNYPMPSVQSKINKLSGCKLFTSLDCTSGYWQIKLTERAKQLAAFICNQGLFQFNCMPFGLCNAGATFQRVIELIIIKLTNSSAYLDDVLTFSKHFDDHFKHLELVFQRFKEANLKIKTSKCKIACDNVMFLGYNISEKGVSVDDSRIKVIKNYPKPTKTKEVKQFLGLAGFYRQFIPSFADIVEPLNRLTRKDVKFQWSQECDKAFDEILNKLITKPILAYPNFDKKFIISTDASNVGIGAVLSQLDENKFERPIYYASRSLSVHERNYSTIEKELLAIVYATEKFRYYVYGREFTITTDHNPLIYLNNITITSERLTRWRLKLAEYNFNIIYRKGKCNANADTLSRVETVEQETAKEEIIETLLNINTQLEVDKIIYNSDNLSASKEERIVLCGTAETHLKTDIAIDLNLKLEGKPDHNDQKVKIGSLLTWKSDTGVIFMVTRDSRTRKPSILNLELCIQNLKDYCLKNKITKIAFAKYKNGLDKLPWRLVKDLINQILIKNKIQCTVYENLTKEQILNNDLSIDDKIKRLQNQDDSIKELKAKIVENKVKGFIIENGVVVKLRKGKNKKLYRQLVVPCCLKEDILALCHDLYTGAHLGEHKTWTKLNNRFYWPNSSKDTQEYVKSCSVCAKTKDSPPNRAYLKPILDFEKPFDKVAVDILELTRSSSGNKYVLVFTDYLTKWTEAFALKDTKAETIATIFVNEIICRHGAPGQLLSDQGKNFLSNLMKEVSEYFNTKKINTAPYNPKCDGLVERFNKTLCHMLASYSDANQANWDLYLPLVLFAYRTSIQETTKESPFYLLYGREGKLPADLDRYNGYRPSDFIENINQAWIEAKNNINKQAEINKQYYDSKYTKDPVTFKEGDYVRVKQKQIKLGLKKKLSNQKYSDPCKITKIISDQNIEINVKGKNKIVNVDNVKKKEKDRENINNKITVTRYGRISIPRISTH